MNDSLNTLKKIAQDKTLIKLEKSSVLKQKNLKSLKDSIPKKPKAFGRN